MSEEIKEWTSVRIRPLTLKKIKSLKITKHEMYDEVINRVFDDYIVKYKKVLDL